MTRPDLFFAGQGLISVAVLADFQTPFGGFAPLGFGLALLILWVRAKAEDPE